MTGRPTFGMSATEPTRFNPLAVRREIALAHKRLARVTIENLPYREVIRRYDRPQTFFYVDPPYWDCEGRYGKDIFGKEDFSILAELLSGLKGKFLLSLNDRPQVRELFKGFRIDPVMTRYSCAANRSIPASEVLIRNY